jgi:twinkle protein
MSMILRPGEMKEEFLNYKGGTGLSTGIKSLVDHLLLSKNYMMITSGYGGIGKSEVIDAILQNMALLYGWRTLYFSPENFPTESHMQKLAERYIGKPWKMLNQLERARAHIFLTDYFAWIDSDTVPTITNLLDIAHGYIAKDMLDCLVIDPWNQLSHRRNDMIHEYLSDALANVLHFTRRNNILTIIVAHPAKPMKAQDGSLPVPGMYDISDGAMWRNKADYGVMVHKSNFASRQHRDGALVFDAEVHVQKVKQKFMGRQGMVTLDYNYWNGRYKNKYDEEFEIPHDHRVPF